MLICEKNYLIAGAQDKTKDINCNNNPIKNMAVIWIPVLSLFAGGLYRLFWGK
jgi:hypothetical protein